jgi:signal transduction histidine kinase
VCVVADPGRSDGPGAPPGAGRSDGPGNWPPSDGWHGPGNWSPFGGWHGPGNWSGAHAWQARRWRGRVGLAVIVALVQVVGARWAEHHHVIGRPLGPVGYALLLAGPVALLLRRRYPLPVLAITLAATLAYLVLNYPYGPVLLAPLVAILAAVRAGQRYGVWALCASAYLGYVVFGRLVPVIGATPTRAPGLGDALALGIWLLIVGALADAVRIRAVHFAEVARSRAESARARAEQNRRQAIQERLRMAQELHDVLGHHLSLISVQAGVGLHLMDERPEQARAALIAIKQASAEALREVRSVLGILRAQDGEEAPPRSPAPSLSNLSTLLQGANAQVVIEGEPRPLAAELDRAAYRIVQEALTNVRRHAGEDATVTVTIGYGPDELTVRIDDDGRGAPASGADPGTGEDEGTGPDGGAERDDGEGSGIPGMRARAAALGGTLVAGPGPAGGFRVHARMPILEPT